MYALFDVSIRPGHGMISHDLPFLILLMGPLVFDLLRSRACSDRRHVVLLFQSTIMEMGKHFDLIYSPG